MHAMVQPLVSWLFSHSLIDAGQRSEKSNHAALSSGITSPTSRSESSFGLCLFEQLALHRSRSGRHQASRRFAKPEGGSRRAHRL